MSRSVITWLLVFAAAVLVTWNAAQSGTPKDQDAELYRLFVDALEHVDRSYVKEIDRRKLVESAIHGMLEELDPYSNYISPDDYNQFSRATTGKFGGVGIQIDAKQRDEPFLTVVSPLYGTPAYEAGILAGDRIVEVEGESLEGLSQSDIVGKLTGDPGTTVNVKVQHAPFDQNEPFDVELRRDVINIESVMGDSHKEDDSWDFMIDPKDKIGYVRISSFTQETSKELHDALEQLEKEGAKGLILDLRYNPGGLLVSAIEVCDMFLSEGAIVSTKGRNTQDRTYSAKGDQLLKDVPIVVLVNSHSASASEIVSACLQDHHRAIVIGERSFGKGSVQNVIELDVGKEGDKSALKLTTASYHRPSGKNIHKFKDSKEEDDWGVSPDEGFVVKFTPEQHAKYFADRRTRDRVQGKLSEREKVKAEPAVEDKAAEEKPSDENAAKDEAADASNEEGDEKDADNEDKADATDSEEKEPSEEEEEASDEPFVDTQIEKALEYLRSQIHEAK